MSRKLRRVFSVAMCAATLTTVALVPQSSAGGRARVLGINYSPLNLPDSTLSRMDAGRVRNIRWIFRWNVIEPTRNHFDWSSPDQVVGSLATRGIRVFPALYQSPSFAAPTPGSPPLGSQDARNSWKTFLRLAVKRYKPGGAYWTDPALYRSEHPGERARPIRTWQIWTEPNVKSFFEPGPSARRYARLLRISDRAIRAADPHAKVILAGVPSFGKPFAWKFLNRLYHVGHGIKRHFDAVALHPYSTKLSQFRFAIRQMRKVMSHHGDAHTALWLTELGWGSRPRSAGGFNVGRKGQARMLRRAFRIVLHRRHRWKLRRAFWYQWRDPQTPIPGCSVCSYSGLFTRDDEPKPAWHAFKTFTGAARR